MEQRAVKNSLYDVINRFYLYGSPREACPFLAADAATGVLAPFDLIGYTQVKLYPLVQLSAFLRSC